jgi:hypothetical protein
MTPLARMGQVHLVAHGISYSIVMKSSKLMESNSIPFLQFHEQRVLFLGVSDCPGCPHSGAARVEGSSASAVASVAG